MSKKESGATAEKERYLTVLETINASHMKSKKEVREVFSLSKYGKMSGKSEDSSSKRGTHPFRQMAIALVSESAKWVLPAGEGVRRSPSRETCTSCLSSLSQRL